MPTAADFQAMRDDYLRVAPHPEHFDAFAEKASAAVGAFQGWSEDELRAVSVPTLILVGDHDFVKIEHAAEMHALIPGAQLAVLPGTTHMSLTHQVDVLVPMLDRFLSAD
jgi:pimeloyl-ACP methyl ester carboxylesterase